MDTNAAPWAVSLVRGDLLFRLQRKIGLIPEQGLGIARRATFWSLLAWLPIAVWAGKWEICYRSMVANHCLPTSESMPD